MNQLNLKALEVIEQFNLKWNLAILWDLKWTSGVALSEKPNYFLKVWTTALKDCILIIFAHTYILILFIKSVLVLIYYAFIELLRLQSAVNIYLEFWLRPILDNQQVNHKYPKFRPLKSWKLKKLEQMMNTLSTLRRHG